MERVDWGIERSVIEVLAVNGHCLLLHHCRVNVPSWQNLAAEAIVLSAAPPSPS